MTLASRAALVLACLALLAAPALADIAMMTPGYASDPGILFAPNAGSNFPVNLPGGVAIMSPPATWSPGPLYVAAEPYILTVFGVVFSALLTWACALFQRRTGIAISQSAHDQIQTAALNAAGRIMASQDERFATMRIDVGNPLIAAELPLVTGMAKGAIDQIGMTPARVGALIAGKVGQLQAQAQGGAALPSTLTLKVPS